MIKTRIKKSFSVFLSVLMILSCWVWVAPHEHTHAEAAVTENGNVAFYVPEVIYLYPEALSSAQATATPFQYYVENTVNTSSIYSQPTTNTELKSTGTVYFAAADGFSDVSISTRFVDSNGNAVSGGSVSVGAFSNKTSYGTFSVTGGTSPSLAAETTGCYLEWTVSYTNSKNERQSAIAYTYIYKPYIFPVAAGSEAGTGTSGGANWAGHVTWISGIHSITPVSTSQGNSFDESWFNIYTKENFVGFISKDNVAYVNGTKYTSGSQAKITSGFTTSPTSTGGSLGYAVFAGTSSTGYWLEQRGDANPSYLGVSSAGKNTPPSGIYNYSVAKYRGNKKDIQTAVYEKSYGNLYIDTSRYNNLNQIPNLGVGMMVTDDENSAGNSGNWYVADYTGRDTGYYNKWYEGSENSSTLYDDRGTVIAAQSTGNYDRSYDETEGIRYVGSWPRALTGSTGTLGATAVYRVKAFYANWEKSWGSNYDAQSHTLCEMKATYYNKSTLRTAVHNAINAMSTLGLKDNYGSYYYDTTNSAWTAFKTAYRNACMGLTKLDGSVDVTSLVNALNSAVTNLKNGQGRIFRFNVNYGGINPNLYILSNVTNGGYGLTVAYNSDESITLNGTISGANAFGMTSFAPKIGTYTFSTTFVSGTINGDGCVVLDSSKDDGNNISTRTNFDFTGAAKKNMSYTAVTAQETDFLRFWQWKDSQNSVYSNFTFKIKVEEGTAQTAYSPASRVASNGTYGTLPELEGRIGYTFGGWYKEAACVNKVNNNDAVSADMLYAKWNPITYTVYFDGNGQTGGSTADQSMTYDTAANLTANGYTKDGYEFAGWNTAADGSGTLYADKASVINLRSESNDTITLYAQWTICNYTVKFINNAGQVVFEEVYPYGTPASTLEAVAPENTAPTAYESKEYHHKYEWPTLHNVTNNAIYYENVIDELHNIKTSVTLPSCSAQGYTTYSCDICNGSYDDDYVDALGHKYEGKVTTEPTCTDNGVMTYTCQNDASHTYTEEIAAKGHTLTQVDAKAPTCTEDGYKAYEYCTKCNYTTYEVDNATGHSYGEWIAEQAATCIATGVLGHYECSVCHKYFDTEKAELTDLTIAIDENNHVEIVEVEAKTPTCTEIGWDAYVTCSRCDYTTYVEKTALGHEYGNADCNQPATCIRCGVATGTALGHSFTNYVSNNDATCLSDGTKTAKCDRCDVTDKVTDEGSTLGHSFTNYVSNNDATCLSDGTKTAKCDRCDVSDTISDEGSVLGHDFTVYVETIDYTCTTGGYDIYKCSRCEETEHQNPTTAAHRPETEYTVIEKATCEVDGYKAILCSECREELETVIIVKRDHTYIDNGVATASTCKVEGVMNTICSNIETETHKACANESTRVIEIDPDAHKAEAEYIETKAPTCSAVGEEKLYCEYCDEVLDTREVAIVADAHKAEAEYIETKAPTCSAVGEEKLYCEYCDEVLDTREVAIVADAHKAEADYTVIAKASCEADGYKAILCEYCDAELETETIAKREHNLIDTTAALEPTCSATGIMNQKCDCAETAEYEACSYSTAREISVDEDAHKWEAEYTVDKSASCEEDGQKSYHCEYCDTIKEESIVVLGSHGHNYVGAVTKDSTCTELGVMTYTCTYDGSHTYEEAIALKAHTTVEVSYKAPTCEDAGHEAYEYCSECTYTTFISIPATDHDFDKSNGVLTRPVKNGSTWVDGYYTYTCKNDASHTTTEKVERADYSAYDELIIKAEYILSEDIPAEDKEKLENAMTSLADNLIISEQTEVDAAVTELNAVINEVYPDVGLTLEIVGNSVFNTGAVIDLKAVKMPINVEATNVEWTSSDDSIVFFSNGRLLAIGTGTVTLTAKSGILEATKTISVVAGGNVRDIKFTAIDKMHFIIEDYFAVYNGANLYWNDADVIRFRVHVYQTFPFETYIVYINGEAVEPDENGYYTVPANAGDIRVTISGAMYNDDGDGNGSKWSFWEWLLALIRKIVNFFKSIFGIK